MATLKEINGWSEEEAETRFLECCGSKRWADQMMTQRPFLSDVDLYECGQATCETLEPADWREAFSHHPRIGDKDAIKAKWAADEQSGVNGASDQVFEALARGNADYEKKFGYIFIVCATGKTAQEMLAILKQRLHNNPNTELPIAALEAGKIAQIRLEKLLA